jgi:L-seryl-tRNA(Ser) seleniumtransferase
MLFMPNNNDFIIASLRDFPAVEVLANHDTLVVWLKKLPRPLIITGIQEVIAEFKNGFAQREKPLTFADLIASIESELKALKALDLRTVVNGTGIIIHTNLGRAPLPASMLESAAAIASGYTNLEYDLGGGARGGRGAYVEKLISATCGTEAGTIVNNNAAAVFLILNTLANRQEVIISRGELVQIGGGFRIPEIMTKAGVKLVEVGTTNRTTGQDYETAITTKTAMILKVHRSNFTQGGFTEETPLAKLAGICRAHSLPLVHDLGSGLMNLPSDVSLPNEPTVSESVRSGADLTCFSGDKLLGGVQSGLIAGRQEFVQRIKKNPLFRAVRCDKLAFALTGQVLAAYLNGTHGNDVPVWRLMCISVTDLKLRGEQIVQACRGRDIVLRATLAFPGGGSAPEESIASLAVSIRDAKRSANNLSRRFRDFDPPIIGRVENDDFLVDLRTLFPEQDEILISAITQILT